MFQVVGKSVSGGVTIGKVLVYERQMQLVEPKKIDDLQAELDRVSEAVHLTKKEFQALYEKAMEETGRESAAIFEAHQIMLEDEVFIEKIRDRILKEKLNANAAVAYTMNEYLELFSSMEDEYMKERALDVKDVFERVSFYLCEENNRISYVTEPVIVVAEDLTPSDTMRIERENLLAIVTKKGGVNSHTAILARMMNIPAVVSSDLEMFRICSGMRGIVDGEKGIVTFEPDERQWQEAHWNLLEYEKNKLLLQEFKGKESVTKDGRRIRIFANIGSVDDISQVLENDADGVGLFRTEFLFLGKKKLPTEEEQYQAFLSVVKAMGQRKVIIRTLDLGSDKQDECLQFEEEPNPALGKRAIRICFEHPEIFMTQLKAIFRAAFYGNISVMYPMVTSVWEVERIKEYVDQVQQELEEKRIPYQLPEQGIMIETPAAVFISAELAKMVDFFSIGTNDLTQYTLAVDRQNSQLEAFYNPRHEAILRMIKMVSDQAHAEGIRVGICGELAADQSLMETFLDMKIDELSVAPNNIMKLRKTICELE